MNIRELPVDMVQEACKDYCATALIFDKYI
jgi:hypothetical protein